MKSVFTKKGYDPDMLKDMPEDKITYIVRYHFNDSDSDLGRFKSKEEAILCLAEKHDDILLEYGYNEEEDNVKYDSDEYFEVEIGANHFIVEIIPIIQD